MPLLVALVVVTTVAVLARWTTLPWSMALGDSLGPWLVAARGPWSTAPHAPPYGWMLAVPHALVLPFAPDLYSAFAAIRVVDALVAPLGCWAAWRLTHNFGGSLAVGLLLALDPSLLDTATSGAEAYQSPVAIALLTLAATRPRARAESAVGAVAFAWAVMCHPLALMAAPFLLGFRWRPTFWLLSGLLLVPHLLRLWTAAPTGTPLEWAFPWTAGAAWLQQSGPAALLFGAGTLAGLWHRRLRPFARATIVTLLLTFLAGTRLGYLRDHHLRLPSAPAALGLAALPGPLALLSTAFLLKWPEQDPGAARLRRPGTLGLLHRTTTTLADTAQAGPLVVDGFRTVHIPAVEPGGVWLDLLLRGVPAENLDVAPTSRVAVLVTGKRDDPIHHAPEAHGLERLDHRDTWSIWLGPPDAVQAWSVADCAARESQSTRRPRVGGAWDGLALVHPERGAASVSSWWTCRHE
jgi:hypothetical protein